MRHSLTSSGRWRARQQEQQEEQELCTQCGRFHEEEFWWLCNSQVHMVRNANIRLSMTWCNATLHSTAQCNSAQYKARKLSYTEGRKTISTSLALTLLLLSFIASFYSPLLFFLFHPLSLLSSHLYSSSCSPPPLLFTSLLQDLPSQRLLWLIGEHTVWSSLHLPAQRWHPRSDLLLPSLQHASSAQTRCSAVSLLLSISLSLSLSLPLLLISLSQCLFLSFSTSLPPSLSLSLPPSLPYFLKLPLSPTNSLPPFWHFSFPPSFHSRHLFLSCNLTHITPPLHWCSSFPPSL